MNLRSAPLVLLGMSMTKLTFALLVGATVVTSTACRMDVDTQAFIEREEKRFTADGVVDLNVSTFDGSVEIRSWDRAEVLVMTGADDSMVPAEAVAKFESEMQAAQADYRVISYPGAKHSFTNPAADDFAKKFNMPVAYNAEADKASWAELQLFLKEVFH